ncbi:MAG: hypothetical protein HC809_00905 [Gammaproteobacteria bacterium]|nr:hypothetical protein [Gammaproteobacteria bacterium]
MVDEPTVLRDYGRSYWLRLPVRNSSAEPVLLLLELNHSRLDAVTAWGPKGNEIYAFNREQPRSNRPIAFPNPVVPFTLEAGVTTHLTLHVSSLDNMWLSARIWRPKAFNYYQVRHGLLVGGALAVLLCLALYNAIIFLRSREPLFRDLAALLAALFLWQIVSQGYASLYLWPQTPGLSKHAFLAAVPLCLAALIAFGSRFAQIEPGSVTARVLSTYTRVCVFLTLVFAALPDADFLKPAFVLLAPTLPLLLYGAGVAAYRGSRGARYFLVATAPLVATLAAGAVSRIGEVPVNSATYQGMFLGASVFLGLLLALALADQIRQLSEARQTRHARCAESQVSSARIGAEGDDRRT